MDAVARYVNLAFMLAGVITYAVAGELYAAILRWVAGSGANPPLLGVNFRLAELLALVTAIGLALYLKRSRKVSTYALEVGNELSKVTWPTWKETRMSTVVVIIVTIIISLILGLFDFVWRALSGLVYNI